MTRVGENPVNPQILAIMILTMRRQFNPKYSFFTQIFRQAQNDKGG